MRKNTAPWALAGVLLFGAACGGKGAGTTSGGSGGTGSTDSPGSTAVTDPGQNATGSTGSASSGTSNSGTGSSNTGSSTTGGSDSNTGNTSTGSTGTGSAASTPVVGPLPASSAAPFAYTREWYVATSGSDSNDGSQSKPFRTISRALSAVHPGERINVMGGSYAEHVGIMGSVAAGTATAPIALQGYSNPILTVGSGSWAMVEVQKPYWLIDGFEIDAGGANHAGVSFSDSTQGDVLSNCDVHSGTAGAAVAIVSNATGVRVDHNHIHDYWVTGQDAHGVLVEWTTRNSTITNNRIHDVSGDSVQCEGPETYSDTAAPADTVLIANNEFFHNGEQGVDIKTCHNVTVRDNFMHDFTESSLPGGCSMVVHMSALDVLVEGNLFVNVGKAIALGGNHIGPVPTNVTIRKNRFVGLHTGSTLDGTALRIENSENAQVLNNTMTQVDGPAMILGHGDQGNTTDLTVENNLVDAANAVNLGGYGVNLTFARNLYRPSATFAGPGVSGALSSWQQKLGYDKDAVSADPQLSTDGNLTPGPVAVDQGMDVGLPFCGAAPEIGAVEVCR